MKYIVLDLSDIESVHGLHAYLKEAFQLPDYYGFNMDALWDCLRCGFEETTTIILRNVSAFPENRISALHGLIRVFEDLKKVGDIADFIVAHDAEDISGYLI